MRKLILALTVLCTSILYIGAESPIVKSINASGTITVNQPEGLDARLTAPANADSVAKVEGEKSETVKSSHRAGYRVKVFDDNNINTARHQAQSRKAMYESRFPEYRAYVSFNSPYWQVTVGDFTSRSRAEAAMSEFKHAFPSQAGHMRIVRARINTGD
jgi:hypothetical protein